MRNEDPNFSYGQMPEARYQINYGQKKHHHLTPLTLAILHARFEIVEVFLKNGADVSAGCENFLKHNCSSKDGPASKGGSYHQKYVQPI